MTQIQTAHSNTTSLFIKFGATIALAMAVGTTLQAQDTVVEGNVQRSDVVQESVDYADLNLRDKQNQMVLISRVRKAAGRVCNILYRGRSAMEKFESRCPQRTYSDTKPQIDLAIASAHNGKQIAISFVVARSR